LTVIKTNWFFYLDKFETNIFKEIEFDACFKSNKFQGYEREWRRSFQYSSLFNKSLFFWGFETNSRIYDKLYSKIPQDFCGLNKNQPKETRISWLKNGCILDVIDSQRNLSFILLNQIQIKTFFFHSKRQLKNLNKKERIWEDSRFWKDRL